MNAVIGVSGYTEKYKSREDGVITKYISEFQRSGHIQYRNIFCYFKLIDLADNQKFNLRHKI